MPRYHERAEKSPLYQHVYIAGDGERRQYKVSSNIKTRLLSFKRQEIIDDFLKAELLPKDDFYIQEWGAPNSEDRVRRTIEQLNFLANETRYDECRRQWREDAKYLITEHLTKHLKDNRLIGYLAVHGLIHLFDFQFVEREGEKLWEGR